MRSASLVAMDAVALGYDLARRWNDATTILGVLQLFEDMQLSIKLYARARDLAGSPVVNVELPTEASVAQLRAAIVQQHPSLAKIVPSLLVALGTDYATDSTRLSETSVVSCFPPVSGG